MLPLHVIGSIFIIMKRLIITTIIAVVISATAFAQKAHDAVNYSQNIYQGGSKAQAMGGAMGAVGSDMTATCINPAGQGLYRSSELAATFGIQQTFIDSKYYQQNTSRFKVRGTIPHFSYVMTRQRNSGKGLRYTQFGIGLTRTNDFNYHSHANGMNPNSSLIDHYLQQIDGLPYNKIKDEFPLTVFPAWDTYLIDTMRNAQGQLMYTSPVPQGKLNQDIETRSRGRSEEWTFAYSANFSDRLFLGASIGITRVKNNRSNKHTEQVPSDYNDNDFRVWTFQEDIVTNGTGANLKVGAIYYPASWIRFGIALHTPTRFSLDENVATSTTANFTTQKYFSQPKPSSYRYALHTSAKAVGSLALIIPQCGMISGDIEVLDYGSAYFISLDGYDYANHNKTIADAYSPTLNFRFGTEWMVGNMFLRGGLAFYGSPYGLKKSEESVTRIGLGAGFPVGDITTLDFAYSLSIGQKNHYPYLYYNAGGTPAIDPIQQSKYASNIAASIKFRF